MREEGTQYFVVGFILLLVAKGLVIQPPTAGRANKSIRLLAANMANRLRLNRHRNLLSVGLGAWVPKQPRAGSRRQVSRDLYAYRSTIYMATSISFVSRRIR